MTTIETPATSVLDAARNAVPVLRENGGQADENRWLPQALEGMTADRWNLDVPGRNHGLIGLVMAEAAPVYIGMAAAADYTCSASTVVAG